MALQEGDSSKDRDVLRHLEDLQRDLSINKFVNSAKGVMFRFNRGEIDSAIVCAFDLAEDIKPPQAIIPGLSGINYTLPYDELRLMVWEKVFGEKALLIGEEEKGKLRKPQALTLRLKSLKLTNTPVMVSISRWGLVPPEHRSGTLSSYTYSRLEDPVYKNPLPLSEIWFVKADEEMKQPISVAAILSELRSQIG